MVVEDHKAFPSIASGGEEGLWGGLSWGLVSGTCQLPGFLYLQGAELKDVGSSKM